ncbi:MAG: HD domain-containing protein [Candidatus Dojkabacteria bacterium]|nr:MAG: HD domain-containing protein [Candidatus Dojkabacteria bacterium]
MVVKLPTYVVTTARILLKEGFKAYLVGGAVRDAFLGAVPADYDIATDALPEDLIKIFPKAIAVGAKFGTILVVQRDINGENFSTEVTTLRSEEEYIKGRWPTKVTFVRNINEDLKRRDFTINAMAVDMGQKGVEYLIAPIASDEVELSNLKEYEFDIVDPFGGRDDIERKVLRTVGNPVERFTEDGLRTYKACRLAAQLGFEIEKETFSAITECLTVARMISSERIRDEFMKLLLKAPKPSVGIDLMRQTGLLEIFLPELIKCIGVDQPIGHAFDVYDHTLRTVDLASDNIRLAALFHDIGKADTGTPDGHFYGHDQIGAEITKKVMRRMRFSSKEIKKVSELVRWHMFMYPFEKVEDTTDNSDKKDIRISTENQSEGSSKEFKGWSDSAVRRFIKRVGLENLDDLFALRIADGTSEPVSMWDPQEIVELQQRISQVLAEDTAFKVSDLAINGNQLMKKFDLKPGKIVGTTLNYLLEVVLDNPNLNNKEKLLEAAEEFLSKQEK